MNLQQRNIEAHKLIHKSRYLFSVSLVPYWNPIFGFNIVRFDDEVLKSPDKKSARQCVRERFGEEAEKVIEQLIAL